MNPLVFYSMCTSEMEPVRLNLTFPIPRATQLHLHFPCYDREYRPFQHELVLDM